jgi:hypothetical protein
MAAVTKNRNFFSCQFLLYCKSKLTQILTAMAKSRLTYILPAMFGLIWFSGFTGKDLNVIFYQNMPNLHNLYKSAERKTWNIC